MINCPMCGKEFKNRRGYSSHIGKHRKGEKATERNLESLLEYIPPIPIHNVEMEVSPEGNIRIRIKKELVTKEELDL